MSRELPIIFSTDMVRGILDGRKTQTRRIIKVQPTDPDFNIWIIASTTGPKKDEGKLRWGKMVDSHLETDNVLFSLPYRIGDKIWVRETWLWVMKDHAHDLLEGANTRTQYAYKGSFHSDWIKYAKEKYGYKWKPSIHMPKDAARIWLEITDVRYERLNDISVQDAIAEGIEKVGGTYSVSPWRNYLRGKKGEMDMNCSSPIRSFQTLWDSIHGTDPWKANPMVWVIEFKVLEALS